MPWTKPAVDPAKVRSLVDTHRLDLLSASILVRRSFADPSVLAFFLEEDERFFHNPFLFPDMESVVDRIMQAAEEGENVLVCGDKDADGITSTTLMVEALQNLGIPVSWRVPVGREDYGLNKAVIKEHAAQDVTLLVAVDCGITDFEQVEEANAQGMDVIILDHHLPREDRLPDAFGIINPKIPQSYPFQGLCAAGVVSKVIWALALASTELYGRSICLFHAWQEEEVIVVTASRIVNLLEVERVSARSDGDDAAREQLLALLQGEVLMAYGGEEQRRLVSAFFGGADVHLIDVREQIAKAFPSLAWLPITELEEKSRMARYFQGHEGPLTAFRNVLTTLMLWQHRTVFDFWRQGLDLVALGTVADMMPLKDENRIFVRQGLERLNASDAHPQRRGALREILIRQNLHETRLGATEIAWKICPLLNAAGRMGQADLGVKLLLEQDHEQRLSLLESISDLNKQRRKLGEDLWQNLRPRAQASQEALEGKMLIVADPSIPRGITGILASRWSQTFGVPAVAAAVLGEEASGSIRCGEGSEAMDWLEEMSSLFLDFGGHPSAGGFRLPAGKLPELEKKTALWLKNRPKKKPQVLTVDAELSHESLEQLGSQGLGHAVARLEPYGEGFRPLIFLTRRVSILQADLVGKVHNNHLKLLVSLGPHKWPAFWWNAGHKYGKVLTVGTKVDLVYRVEKDSWRGGDAYRLTILEADSCSD